MESPPKRVTRARAAKAGEPVVKPTKIITAAAKAKSKPTATASTRSTAAKRKQRADDSDAEDADEDDEDDKAAEKVMAAPKATRGRPKKAVEAAPELTAPTRATRSRPAKKLATEASKQAAAAPVRATRGRPRKDTEAGPEAEASKKSKRRGRSGTASKATASTTAKAGIKKSVKFAEPGDKENIEPPKAVAKKDTTVTGMSGRPARRGGATVARSTRKTNKSSEGEDKKPLSPKKVTQMPVQRGEESEDELAGPDQAFAKPLKKSPVKPPSNMIPKTMQPESAADDSDDDATTTVNMAILNPPTALTSPAKRPQASAFKDSMKSPARKIGALPFPTSALRSASTSSGGDLNASPSKNALLFSAAKRPPSPIKGLSFGSPSKASSSRGQTSPSKQASMLHSPAKRAMPGVKPLADSRVSETVEDISETPAMKVPVVSTPAPDVESSPSEKLLFEPQSSKEQETEEANEEDEEEEPFREPIRKIQFQGRLSDVMPRDTDPSFSELEADTEENPDSETLPVLIDHATIDSMADVESMPVGSETVAEQHAGDNQPGAAESQNEQVVTVNNGVLEDVALDEITFARGNSSPASSEKSVTMDPNYQLRDKDLNPCADMDVDSDSELLSPSKTMQATPSGRMSFAAKSSGRRSTIGLTSLAEQFGSWETASPDPLGISKGETEEKAAYAAENSPSAVDPTSRSTPSTSHFFEDEIQPHVEGAGDVIFDDVMVEKEDVDLADEADKMSELMSEAGDELVPTQSFEDSVSEASQEYGDENDENQVPIDPAILGRPAQPIVTPVRPQQQRTFNTTTKVPLKPADESTPSPLKKRSFSVSRLPPRRSGGTTGSTNGPSLSPTKGGGATGPSSRRSSIVPSPSRVSPTTPTKASNDPILDTPGRVRPEVDPALLRGAVVFVDVHTTEGADASSIFIELLTQMGARCRKTWDWTPPNESNGDPVSSKVGITHVVYKDGGKRTLQKVRQTQGLVQCVGVSWVLE